MRDVASTAGVSLKTVSRVVNSEAGVRPATAARVEAAIAHLGFARNDLARSLRHGRASALGLVIEDVANPFYSAIAQAVEDAAHERGHILITGSCEEDPERERELVLRCCAVGRRAAHRPRRRRAPLPAARHRRRHPDRVPRPPAGRHRGRHRPARQPRRRPRRVEHLSRTATSGSPTSATRRRSTRPPSASPATAPRSRRRAAPRRGAVRAGSHDAAAAERAVRALLALPADRRPTALFTSNNRNTVGALRALRDGEGRSRSSASTTSSSPTCSPARHRRRPRARADGAHRRRAGLRAPRRRRRPPQRRPSTARSWPAALGSCAAP